MDVLDPLKRGFFHAPGVPQVQLLLPCSGQCCIQRCGLSKVLSLLRWSNESERMARVRRPKQKKTEVPLGGQGQWLFLGVVVSVLAH